jgi:hypothetical protein
LDRPDAPVFPQAAVGHLGPRLPFRGVADSHPDAASLWDADLDVVRRACLDTVDAIPERHRGLPVRLDEAVEKLAGREPRLAGVVPGHLDPASAVFPGLPAWVALVERWARLRVEVELYIPGEALFAA